MLIWKGLCGLKIIYVDRFCIFVISDVFKEIYFFFKKQISKIME